jgi:hypothetical protein
MPVCPVTIGAASLRETENILQNNPDPCGKNYVSTFFKCEEKKINEPRS